MYEGLKNEVFKPKYEQPLYRGTVISNSELQKLDNLLNEQKNNNVPKAIIYFRSFQSYTLKKNITFSFMNTPKNLVDKTKVLFIVEPISNNLQIDISNAYIKDFSAHPKEEEVLFFPYSSFVITNINKDFTDHIEITLVYPEKYSQNILYKDPKDILPFFQTSKFGKEMIELDLINYNIKDSWKIEKEININDGNVSSILYLGNNLVLFSVNKTIKLYDIIKDHNIRNIDEHQNEIKDLLKIDNNKFISSSKDSTIKIFELYNNFLDYKTISTINIHNDEVNQTIKLQMKNYYASCSNDKKISIWIFEDDNKNQIEEKKIEIKNNFLEGHESEVISIFE
jgi:WD40 repeat protein